jgi:hypothetical protein
MAAAPPPPPPPVVSLAEAERADHDYIVTEMGRLAETANFVLAMILRPLPPTCLSVAEAAGTVREPPPARCDLCRVLLDFVLLNRPSDAAAPLASLGAVRLVVRTVTRRHNKSAMLYVFFLALALQRDAMVRMLTCSVHPDTGLPNVQSREHLVALCEALRSVLMTHTLPAHRRRLDGYLGVFVARMEAAAAAASTEATDGADVDPFEGLFLSTTACVPPHATPEMARHEEALQTPLEFVSFGVRRAAELFPRDMEAGWPPALAHPTETWLRALLADVRARAPDMPLHIAVQRLGALAETRLREANKPAGWTFLPDPVALV